MKIKINKTQWEFIGKQSGWADQIKTAQTKRSVNYYSYKQNPDGGLVNGSFIREKNGKFVGGKFDWISTDRLSRGLENCHDGYSGWNLKDIPNPAEAVFLIAGVSTPNGSTSSGKRTNAIKGTWKR